MRAACRISVVIEWEGYRLAWNCVRIATQTRRGHFVRRSGQMATTGPRATFGGCAAAGLACWPRGRNAELRVTLALSPVQLKQAGAAPGIFTKDIQTMDDLFLHVLQDICYAENQIVKALPDMIEKATNRELTAAAG